MVDGVTEGDYAQKMDKRSLFTNIAKVLTAFGRVGLHTEPFSGSVEGPLARDWN
jgi:hypothetical protein